LGSVRVRHTTSTGASISTSLSISRLGISIRSCPLGCGGQRPPVLRICNRR
jgi:hypothetical protein